MKIRSDFVTNSSSSSFVVSLELGFADGASLRLTNGEDTGDFESREYALTAKDAAGAVTYAQECSTIGVYAEEMEVFDPDEIPWEINERLNRGTGEVRLSDIRRRADVNALMDAIRSPFGLDSHLADETCEDEDEEDCEFEELDEEAAEMFEKLREKFDEMVDTCDEVLSAHLNNVDDLKTATVTMEFGGRGEFLANDEEIFGKLFDWEVQEQVVEALNSEEPFAALRALPGLEAYTDHALEEMVRFWQGSDGVPATCKVVQSLCEDGKIDLSIEWDNDLF